jgi:uncharacterized damage-inducible protein DinB
MQLQSATFRKLLGSIKGLSAQQLATRPAKDKWSIKEIITHLADCELVYGFRYRNILAQEAPELVAFDQELWAGNLNYHQRDLRSVLEMFKTVRQNNLNLMKLKPAKEWQRVGRHAEFGQLTFEQIVIHLTQHDLSHLEQIRQTRQHWRAKK